MRANISPDILRIMDSQLPYKSIGIGGIAVITALDAKTDERKELRLQLVQLEEVQNHSKAVFAVLTDDFCFYGENGVPHGPLPVGTLIIGGLAMIHLPQPVMRMVGLGGLAKGSDFSLYDPDGQDLTLIIHQISELSVIAADPKFQVPATLENYLKSQAAMDLQRSVESDEAGKEWKAEVIADITKRCEGKIDHLIPFLEGCGPRGVGAIANFLYLANEQGKLEEALKAIEQAHKSHFAFQPPGSEVYAHPNFGSNSAAYAEMYREAGIEPNKTSDEEVTPKDNADEHYQRLHGALSSWDLTGFEAVREIKVAELAVGQLVLAETSSGNRYLLEASDPENMVVNALNLKRREGFPIDGYMPDVKCANIFIGNPLITSKFQSSSLAKLYLQKV